MAGLSEAQLAVRFEGIGGSEVGAVLGISKWAGPGNVGFEKLSHTKSFSGNKYTVFGEECESVVARIYERFYLRKGLRLLRGSEAAETLLKMNSSIEVLAEGDDGSVTFCHKDFPWWRITPDRILSDFTEVDEIKWISLSSFNQNFRVASPGVRPVIPHDYHMQVMMQEHFFGIHAGRLLVGFGGNNLRAFHVTYRQESAERALAVMRTFWSWIERREADPSWAFVRKYEPKDSHPLPASYEEAEGMVSYV